MKNTKKLLNAAIVAVIALFTAINISAMQSPEQQEEERRFDQRRRRQRLQPAQQPQQQQQPSQSTQPQLQQQQPQQNQNRVYQQQPQQQQQQSQSQNMQNQPRRHQQMPQMPRQNPNRGNQQQQQQQYINQPIQQIFQQPQPFQSVQPQLQQQAEQQLQAELVMNESEIAKELLKYRQLIQQTQLQIKQLKQLPGQDLDEPRQKTLQELELQETQLQDRAFIQKNWPENQKQFQQLQRQGSFNAQKFRELEAERDVCIELNERLLKQQAQKRQQRQESQQYLQSGQSQLQPQHKLTMNQSEIAKELLDYQQLIQQTQLQIEQLQLSQQYPDLLITQQQALQDLKFQQGQLLRQQHQQQQQHQYINQPIQQPFQSAQPQLQQQQQKPQQQKPRPKQQFINNNNQNQPQQRQNSKFGFVELPMNEMIYYTALIEFYKEYKAQVDQNKSGESIVSFPIRSCDPLPIKTFGGVRWFTTSAISGNRGEHGINFEIVNPSITNVLAVRGKTNNGKAEFYFGYDANNPQFRDDKNKIFQGILLYLVNKQPLYSTENRSVRAFPDVAHLSSRLTNRFEKYLFRQHDGSQIAIDQNFYRELSGTPFECYWTETENKLKGIQYKNNKK